MCKICDFKYDDKIIDRISDEIDISYIGETCPSLTDENVDWWIEVEFIFDRQTGEFSRTCAWIYAKADFEWDETIHIRIDDDVFEHTIPLSIDEPWLLGQIFYCPECGRDLTKLTIQDVEKDVETIMKK